MSAKRKNFRAGQGTFVVACGLGRAARGSLPGESRQGRDQRVMAYIEANPHLSNEQVAAALKVPTECARAMRHQGKLLAKEAAEREIIQPQFGPPARNFTPSPPPPPTPAARLAAVSDADKAAIAARYGATFKR